MSLIKELQECKSISEADNILNKLRAKPGTRKCVETAIILSNSQDPQQREHAYSFMESAIKELEDDKKVPVSPVQEEHDDDDEHKIHEEELKNNNQGPRTDGSDQSTENEEPYSGTATDSTNGEKPMQDMDNTQNQWNEIGMPPGMGGMPGGMPNGGGMPGGGGMPNGGGMPGGGGMANGGGGMANGGGGMVVPGLAPDIAQEMGMGMPQMPNMDTNQMMRQMQYTLDSYHKNVVSPLRKHISQQREAIKQQNSTISRLSNEIKESISNKSGMTLDLDHMRENATARFRETEMPVAMYNGKPLSGLQPDTTRKKHQLDSARNEILEMDRIIRSENNIYN